ncbi:acyl-CoA carboxylase subunit beta [Paratissierella segnis]|jgi:acetyl-CoA carboxylase carboxyltransferase component|uniref:Methylmalonyl-CoA carboxyltransferase n=1 Tax=Paratissierella segnis TaxID=2763679 RepID=A0A926ETH6_9FIRM|nr:carboxyl transferase domain-containing protein [Paratissierella segnis]MBC8587948.1 methylmalonyl-CoA carboxyltransferase [Paratissierella segnis]
MREKIENLLDIKAGIDLGGGAKRIEKQHNSGKMTARERINSLLDEDSFVEIDKFVEHRSTNFDMTNTEAPADGVVTGYGTVDGRLIFVYAQDFTVVGGSLGEMHANKICKVQDMAVKMGVPIVGFNDSGGARIQEGVDALSGYGKIFYRNTIASGVIPQISVIMGPCAGGAVYSPSLTDFTFMVDKTSMMFITGPQVIKSVTGEEVTQEELGGASTHNKVSGVAHFIDKTELECIERIKELLSFLPSNNLEVSPIYDTNDYINRVEDKLNEIVPDNPNKPYDMKEVIGLLADEGKFFELQSLYAQNILTGYIRLNGKTIGVVANQPRVLAGCLDINASDKAGRFIRTCDAFNIPLLSLVDVPGFLPGTDQEYGGIIRHGAKMLYAFSEATVPKVTLIIRKAYGGAYLAMCSKDLGADQVFAWPNSEIAVMGPEGAANIIFKNDINTSNDPIQIRKEKIEEYRDTVANPYIAAQRGFVDDILVPSTTRPRLISAFDMLESKRENRPKKKHGNLPV